AVLSVAQRVYDERDYAALPVLADALEDAGCDSRALLEHCRGGGEHWRGCRAVDVVLDKEGHHDGSRGAGGRRAQRHVAGAVRECLGPTAVRVVCPETEEGSPTKAHPLHLCLLPLEMGRPWTAREERHRSCRALGGRSGDQR